jgi:hypothetical protein
MIRKEVKNVGIDKIDVYYEDKDFNYFQIADLSPYFSIGKNSFLVDVISSTFVQNGSFRIEIKDADNNDVYVDYPEYREGEMRRISVWIYPDNANGTGKITMVGELKNVPSEWQGVYNVRCSMPIIINKELPNTQPIRFYDTPSASISEYRKTYLNRRWVNDEITIVSGSEMSTIITDMGEYLLNVPNNEFDYRYDNAIINIQDKDPVQVKDVINKNLISLNIPYSYSSSYEGLQNASYSIQYDNDPTISLSENFQSYAKITLDNIEPLSGEVKKVKTYLKSKGAIGETEYTLVNEININPLELMTDQSETGSTTVQVPKFTFCINGESYVPLLTSNDKKFITSDLKEYKVINENSSSDFIFTGSIAGISNNKVYFDWDDNNITPYMLEGTSSDNLIQIKHIYTPENILSTQSIELYKWDNITYLDFSNQIGLSGLIDNINLLSNLEVLDLSDTSVDIDINIINNFPNLNTCSFYSSSINSYTSKTMLDFSSNNNFYMNVSNVNLNSESVDQLLIDLASVPQTGTGSLIINGTNESRTSASDYAVETLTQKYWNLDYNEDRVPSEIKVYIGVDNIKFTSRLSGSGYVFVDWNDIILKNNSKENYSLGTGYITVSHEWDSIIGEVENNITQSFYIYNNYTHISCSHDSKMTFDLSKMPSSLERLEVSGGLLEVDGNLSNVSGALYLEILGNNNNLSYTSGTYWPSMSYLKYNPSESCGLSTEQIDNLINDINSNNIESGTLWLAGNNESRSFSSSQARSDLIKRGWDITLNEEEETWDFWVSGSIGKKISLTVAGDWHTSMSVFWDDNSNISTKSFTSSGDETIGHEWNSSGNYHVLVYGSFTKMDIDYGKELSLMVNNDGGSTLDFLKKLPNDVKYFGTNGNYINIVDGNWTSLSERQFVSILNYGFNMNYIKGTKWGSGLKYLKYLPTSSNFGLSSVDVDNILIDIDDNISSEITGREIWLAGNNGSRTFFSNNASESLVDKGWDIMVNEDLTPTWQFEHYSVIHNEISMSFKGGTTNSEVFYIDWNDGSDIDEYTFITQSDYVEVSHSWIETDTHSVSVYANENYITHISMSEDGYFEFNTSDLPSHITSLIISGGMSNVELNFYDLEVKGLSEIVIIGNNVAASYNRPPLWILQDQSCFWTHDRWDNLLYIKYDPNYSYGLSSYLVSYLIQDISRNEILNGELWLRGNNSSPILSIAQVPIASLESRGWDLDYNSFITPW